ncbi:MAG: hypothetical protein A3E78_17030 [Alphaproteobacteria bacterium RIFCSPHIGHO2_12_FULL_63_12]|nr:MAG: hypothetical protein A3E78_17030 [Alphaproteobacteria bacterium RIFCSPHIGHO2_12_FULL_63_12]
MSSSVSNFSHLIPEPSVDLQDFLAAAKTANAPAARRRKPAKLAGKSEVAGSALVAALLGSQFAQDAQAAEDFARARDELSWLRNVRICTGRAHFDAANRSHARFEHDGGASGGDFSHASHAGFSATGGFRHSAHALDDGDRMQTAFSRDGHGGHRGFEPRFSPRDGAGSHAHDDATELSTGGAQILTAAVSTGGHGHVIEDVATDKTTSGGKGSGGHTGHKPAPDPTDPTDPTVPTDPTDPTGPMPMDPAMMKEHAALMNLVPASAATHVAVTDGSWFDPNTWANHQVPGDGAKVLIPQGVTVDYDGKSPASIFTVRVDGEIDFATDVDTFMEVDTFVVTHTGVLTIGTEANPVDANVSTVISFADNGPINTVWDPMLLSRGLISHGAVDIHGAEKETFLKVAVDPMKGDTSLTLESPPDGWQVGDKLVLTGTHLVSTAGTAKDAPITTPTQDEELIITAINGNVITFDHPLAYNHEGARADLKAYVANYSRNIVFESEGGEATNVHQRGHVMFGMSDDVTVKYAEFYELGRTDKSVRSFDAATLSTTDSDTNVKARYSLHLHHTGVGDPSHPAIIEGNAVWGAPGWGFVQHDSNAIMSDNAAYDVFGAAFVAETGNEIGRWDHNIAIKSLGVNHITKDGSDVGAFDLGRTGTGFWFQGRLVDAVDNVAAGVPSGGGFTYFHRAPSGAEIPVDPDGAPLADALRYLDGVGSNTPNISIFLNNETIASEMGLEIVKANPKQDSDLRSVIDSFLAWEVKSGAAIQYTGHYTFKNIDFVATDSAGIGLKYTIGLDLANNVFDVVVNGGNIEGFYTGVRQAKTALNQFDFMNALDQWEYVYIDLNVKGATWDFTNPTAGDKFLTAADLTPGQLDYQSAYAETHITQVNSVYNLLGTKTDSIGQTAGYKPWDPDYIGKAELRGSIEQNGYWTTTDGRRVALIEEYYSDRATGDVIKVGVFVEIPTSYVLKAGGFTRIDPVNNGVLNQNSRAPIAQDDTASVTQGHSVVIDVLANDKDPDGDAIHLDGLFSQHGHVVANSDGTVSYFADPGFSGDDVFYYFVQDSNGDITKAQVTVTVDI